MLFEVETGRGQRRLGSGRKHEEIPGPARIGSDLGESFFHDYVDIGPAETERTHAGSPWLPVCFPFRQRGVDVKRAVSKIDERIRRLKVQAWRYCLVLQGQRSLDQTGHSGGCIEMTNIGL